MLSTIACRSFATPSVSSSFGENGTFSKGMASLTTSPQLNPQNACGALGHHSGCITCRRNAAPDVPIKYS